MNIIKSTLVAVLLATTSGVAPAARAAEEAATNYLYIMKFAIAPGQVPADGIATASEMVRVMRKSGHWKSVRLFFHDTGPDVAVYVLSEPKSWQDIKDGNEKMVNEMEIMNSPFPWASHSDNLLSEVTVQ